ncbi:8030_t:CDS:2 [Entrophospora sp. SA101]|nr:8030_t:CDS:2 [Entrophospora sp. SA101]
MGRPKNQPRIKGNVQPASSSRAAEVIAAKGNQTSVSNLGGFSQFIGASAFTNVNSAELNSDNVNDVNLDSELVIILKRLSKRDSTTKLKALDDLESYLKNKIEKDDVFVSIMDAWKLAPFLKEIIGVWIISMFDQSKDVARIANESFEAAFSPEKRIEVLIFCQSEIINFIKEIIIYKTPETLSDPRFTSKEDMNSKYARVLASSYYVLAINLRLSDESDQVDESLEIDIDEPYTILENLNLEEVKELHGDILKYLSLEKNPNHLEFWRAMIVVCDDKLSELHDDEKNHAGNVIAPVKDEINKIFEDKTYEQLQKLQLGIQQKLSGKEAVDIE